MDDFEHSVIIAERDWESFYEESEECSIQQAWLASLDDSGLSDTDDEKNSTQEPVLDLQIEPDKPDKEPNAAALTQNEVDNCKAENPSEEPGCSSYTKDDKRCIEQETGLNDVSSTCACLTLDNSVSANDVSFPDQQNTASDMKDLREHDESRSKDKSCQAIGGPITSFPCVQDEGETALQVLESSATPKKEKERWFVTVNDSPVMVRAKSGQKKGRKKKTSRKLVQQSLVSEKEFSVSNHKKEEGKVMNDRQILQNEFMQPFQTCSGSISFNPPPNHICKDDILGSCSNQEVDLPPTKEPKKAAFENLFVPKMNCTSETSSFIAKEEMPSFALSFKCKDNSDVSETNPYSSVISNSPIIHTEYTTTQSETDALVNRQSVASKPKSNTQVTTLDFPTTDNLSHKGHEDTQDDSPRFILETLPTTTPLEKLQEQQYPTQMQEELKLDPRETQNPASQTKSLEATVGPNCPIYALSPFWNEMEKLTINDILHLRSAYSASPMSESTTTEESDDHLEDKVLLTSKHDGVQENGLMDDSADSDYFTQVDEAKRGRSSCELSNLSDFDEEFLQTFNRCRSSSPEPQHVKEQMEDLRSPFIPGHEFNLDNQSESHDIHQNGMPQYLYPANELYLTSSQHSNGHPFEMESIRKTPVLLFGHTEDTQDINEACSSDRRSNTVNSFPFAQNLSVCEMYDDFYSEFELGNFLFPSTQDRPVPIFSASRSAVRDMIPEVEELDFDPDFEEDNMPIRDTTCFCRQPEMYTCPSGMPNLCFAMSQRGNWSSLYSLRRIRFIGKGSIWHHKISSWTDPKEAKNAITYVSRAQQIASDMQAGNKSHLQLAETRKPAVLFSEKEDFIFSIMQSDMCLVCIAFASWVMKSYNSQSTDMWKAALLANVSAISAIQYMRIYGKGH